jgi:hypothetical protein
MKRSVALSSATKFAPSKNENIDELSSIGLRYDLGGASEIGLGRLATPSLRLIRDQTVGMISS